VATILDNDGQLDGQTLRSTLEQLLQAMERDKAQAGSLATGIDHFLKVTRSYAPGLFHCYDLENLPRTNNDLEHLFGRWRHHQRRCTGRKAAPASLVVEGQCKSWQPSPLNCIPSRLQNWQWFLLQHGTPFALTSITSNTSAVNNVNFVVPQQLTWLIWSRSSSS
jgi:hypothetical protein